MQAMLIAPYTTAVRVRHRAVYRARRKQAAAARRMWGADRTRP